MKGKIIRHPKAYTSFIITNFIHLRNPWVTAWWSLAFPGFGHILLCNYARGFLLVIWEVFININTKLNLAIVYSFTGQFDLAKEALNTKWLLLYVPVYIYAVWDSYHLTVEYNSFSVLADRDESLIVTAKISAWELNFLEKRIPWISAAWSFLMPGLGQIYDQRLPTGFFMFIWWTTITYFSNILEVIHLTFVGDFSQAIASANPQWLLFMPSIFGFAIYDAYIHAVENNKLFELEQSRFLKENYQDPDFKMPV